MLNKIERACAEISHNGDTVTFVAVAERTGIARSTLYRNQHMRSIVEHHRSKAPNETMLVLTDELTTLRVTVETLAEKIRHHDAQLRRLGETQ